MARKRLLTTTTNADHRILASKLQVLAGTGGRRPSLALRILTGGVPESRAAGETDGPGARPPGRAGSAVNRPQLRALPSPTPQAVSPGAPRQPVARTVYLLDRHLRDLEAVADAWELATGGSKRLSRSAIVRQAIARLRAAVDAGLAPATEEGAHV
jgi:hypothetical protein